VDIFQFFWAALAWMTTVAILWPANVPLAALAFRIWRESGESEIEGSELWWRAAYASFVLAAIMAAFIGIDWLLADRAEISPGPIHITVFGSFVALAAWVMVYFFSLNDYFEGLSLVVIYLFLPLLVLFVLNAGLGFLNPSLRLWDFPVNLASDWLVKPPS
jgi:hypothetical protein